MCVISYMLILLYDFLGLSACGPFDIWITYISGYGCTSSHLVLQHWVHT